MNKIVELYTWAVDELKSRGITDTKFTHKVISKVPELYGGCMSEIDIKKAIIGMINEKIQCKIPSVQTITKNELKELSMCSDISVIATQQRKLSGASVVDAALQANLEILANDGVDNSKCQNGIKHENCDALKIVNLTDEFNTRLSEVKTKNDILKFSYEGLSIDDTAEGIFGLLSKNISKTCSCNGVCLKSAIIKTIKESITKLLDARNKTEHEILETAINKVISRMDEAAEISKYFDIPVITAYQTADSNTIDMNIQEKNYNGPKYTSGNVTQATENDINKDNQSTELDCIRTNKCLAERQKNIKNELINFAMSLIKDKFEDMNGKNTKYRSFVADYVESAVIYKYMLTYRCDFNCMKDDIRKAIDTAICDRITENDKVSKYREYVKIMQTRYELLPENCGVVSLLLLFSVFNDAIADEIYNDENIQKAINLLLVDHYGDRFVNVDISLFTNTPFISMGDFVLKLSNVLGLKSILD